MPPDNETGPPQGGAGGNEHRAGRIVTSRVRHDDIHLGHVTPHSTDRPKGFVPYRPKSKALDPVDLRNLVVGAIDGVLNADTLGRVVGEEADERDDLGTRLGELADDLDDDEVPR